MEQLSPCCRVPLNSYRLSLGLVLGICWPCGRRHFELTIERGVYGLRGAAL
jgi:hypothetical protein